MSQPTIKLIEAIRKTAQKLERGVEYQWGHMGSCNCGLLAQELTSKSKGEIHSSAMERYGDWTEQLNDYCPTSGLKMDDLIDELLSNGLTTTDLAQLEKLNNPEVLKMITPVHGYIKHNKREDLLIYLNTWATLLEHKFSTLVEISDVFDNSKQLEKVF